MMRLNLQLTMGTFSLSLFGLIGVAFGMNLESSLEEVRIYYFSSPGGCFFKVLKAILRQGWQSRDLDGKRKWEDGGGDHRYDRGRSERAAEDQRSEWWGDCGAMLTCGVQRGFHFLFVDGAPSEVLSPNLDGWKVQK